MKKRLIIIFISLLLFASSFFIQFNKNWQTFSFYLIILLVVGGDILLEAIHNIFRGKIFDENFLMSIATIGAFFIHEYQEAIAVMLFYQIGEFFQNYAINKSRKSIADLMDIRPDYAIVVRNNEKFRVSPNQVFVGEIIVVSPGEKIPLDGKVINGTSLIDTMALTGESVPKEVFVGDQVFSGSINLNRVILIEVLKEFHESTVSKIVDLVENASAQKASSEKFITKFAHVYTPIVVIIAILLTILPPLIFVREEFSTWLYRALIFLVVSCPCALVISIPMSFFGGIGGASRQGILIKGSNYLESLAEAQIIIFDKTGTLTQGVFEVQKINPINILESKLLEIAAHAESFSNHPISKSIIKYYNQEVDHLRVQNIEEISGYGIKAEVDGENILIGNDKLMIKYGISYSDVTEVGTIVHIAINHRYKGYILIADSIKKDSLEAITQLRKLGIKKMIMLTGDNHKIGKHIANQLNLDEYYTDLLPQDKVRIVEEILTAKKDKEKVVFVGDGINDAPVLTRSDVGIAMGGLGADAAIEAADIILMTDEPTKIITAIEISKKTLRIAKQNIFFAIGIKSIVLLLSAIGITNMWMAIFADVGVSILAILNAFRALYIKK